jgi:hypothetical protein
VSQLFIYGKLILKPRDMLKGFLNLHDHKESSSGVKGKTKLRVDIHMRFV